MSVRLPSTVRLMVPALFAVGWPVAAAQDTAGAVTLVQGQGYLEVQRDGGSWAPQTGAAAITTGLRSGTGRAILRAGAQGTVIMGSASQLRRLRDEADLTRGRFFLRGPVAVHVQGNHVVMEGRGQLRVDLADATQRVAVLSGSVRIDLNGKVVTVEAGQQVALRSGTVTAFRENDPWYAAQFRGEGDAVVQATRGAVRLGTAGSAARSALVGDALRPGSAVNTGRDAWAEIGFSGGGYLRLNEQSELSVLSVERTETGREVLLRLARGTAWNVVEKGQGGYRLDTPVVSTAVRGTVFRVDASGVVKVFEGQVALPSQGDTPLAQGQARTPDGALAPLVLDDTDRLNQSLDVARAAPLVLDVGARAVSLRDLAVQASSQPGAGLSVTIAGRTLPLSGQEGQYRLDRLEDQLPEGQYRVQVRASRAGQTITRTQVISIDRTPPALSGLRAERQGRVLIVSGTLRDASPARVTVTVTAGPTVITHHVNGAAGSFRWLLPSPGDGVPVTLIGRDAAGNESRAVLP
ncbi:MULTISPECIES: FecR family protein [Deinococcus]|uniref:FecR family protein n=1 Tax=Deinococcus rufus TaxID=2136097 RepID=A0ABV7Z7V5_9DEIO|nr:FecR family protein [Deinococcus sp. AB2017081]WQE96166.1 FecR family protein [Deinococcus sp. AB2017081]